ncbi:MAG: protein O-mannosyl-transferase family, partial [Patescibacteria group bacterium]
QATGIYGGDSGDLVTAAATFGIPHPPGYPLYTFLGWLLTHLPLATPAWRVGLLSTLPHAATLTLVYLLVYRATRKVIPALFAAVALLGNYLFFLYGTTVEVFALFDFFIISLVYLFWRFSETRNHNYLLGASFVFGLALSHHQVILFMLPGVFYWLWRHYKSFRKSRTPLFIFALILGLLPYLYIPIAARGGAIINWDRPVDWANFVRLVTRADYGTFVSSGFYGALLSQRLLSLKAYGQFLFIDLTLWGLILSAAGLIWLWRKQRQFLLFWLILLTFLGPGFFFYASFPLMNRFTLGTYERFLLPSYILLYPLVGLGLTQVIDTWRKLAGRLLPHAAKTSALILPLVLSLYPLATFGVNLWRFNGLREDRTAENLASDILMSVPPESILFLVRDTPLFTTQYQRYAQGVRPDVIVLHTHRLVTRDYPQVLRRVFPQLAIPEKTGEDFPLEFIKANREKRPIFSNSELPLDRGWYWVPHGLVYRLTPERDLPAAPQMLSLNRSLWERYHNPQSGILSRYPHLMLSDVADVYAASRVSLGKTLLRAGE